mmetsp:Transcript_31095/g.29932  ORF Transcript_31095/g.29932 Transcript_31095/m.29932 type:complete len:160 (-) Transcript_31095:128-607(-)
MAKHISESTLFAYVLFGFVAGYQIRRLVSSSSSWWWLGVKERKAEKAWVLTVTLTFQFMEDRDAILADWSQNVVPHCRQHEPFLYHYEAGISDDDKNNNLQVIILERYANKDLYLKVHKTSDAFLKFRPKLQALQENGKVKIEGFSYQEGGYGFTTSST